MVMIWIGVTGLVLAGICLLVARSAAKRVRGIAGTETSTIAELDELHRAAEEAAGAGHFRYRCEIVADTVAPAAGPLISELGKRECVWHKHRVTHKYWETRTDNEGNRRREEKTRVVSQHVSEEDLLVRDATGDILVRPGKKEIDQPEKTLDRFERDTGGGSGGLSFGGFTLNLPSGGGSIGFQQEEWTVAPGRRLYVLGEASDDHGRLMIGPPFDGGLFIVSTRSEEELLGSARGRERGFGIAGRALGVIGALLLLAGAVSALL
ncbi:E3 ubiquitin ligase family protein [Streptomyces sp. ST2-7A]|uniref:E3 ubiquitin ligase family protein n=1 Tax=Streptomyces sp. ST2-7A TaxID=2907214 RepID=UPI001F393C54|nr:E3 ubiquitin ligase family protein [Streptomyces sp. ST2-7A]MCE7080920.1 E3 ubiquitin ligase family protein [Streptomyces sp. ST2-7A]